MGQQGADVQLSPAAAKLFPYAIECKSYASFVGYGWYDQAKEHATKTTKRPIAVIKANHRDPLVIVDLDDFMELTRRAYKDSL